MSISMLLVDVYIVEGSDSIVGPGYVRIASGVISHIGVGEPPEEARLAELVLGGAGRLLYPGFGAALVYPETYIIRDYIGQHKGLPGSNVEECIREMSSEEAFYSILMALYEMSLAGYARVILATPHVSAAIRAVQEAGIDAAILVPVRDADELDTVLQLIKDSSVLLGLLAPKKLESLVSSEDVKARCIVENECSITCNNKSIIPFGCEGDGVIAPLYPFVTPAQILWLYRDQGLVSLTEEAHKLVDKEYVALGKENKAYISVYDLSEPPSWIGPIDYATPYVLTPLVRVETLISAGRLVVDSGEHLFLGPGVSEKASNVLLSVRKRCKKVLG